MSIQVRQAMIDAVTQECEALGLSGLNIWGFKTRAGLWQMDVATESRQVALLDIDASSPSLLREGAKALAQKVKRILLIGGLDTRDLLPEDDVSVEHDGTWVSFRHEGHEVLLVVVREEGVSPMATSAITKGRLKGTVAAYLRADAFFRRNGLAVL